MEIIKKNIVEKYSKDEIYSVFQKSVRRALPETLFWA